MNLNIEQIIGFGLKQPAAIALAQRINELSSSLTVDKLWQVISKEILTPDHPFELHLFLFNTVFTNWDSSNGPPPAWIPTEEIINSTNITTVMKELNINSYDEFFQWSIQNRDPFWKLMINRLNIQFKIAPTKTLDTSSPSESPCWLPDAQFNIVDSCFQAAEDAIAIIAQPEDQSIITTTYGELKVLTNRVANGISDAGFNPDDAIAICMPMTTECVAIYLGIIKAGCVAVSIADSFAPDAIALRLEIANCTAVFTQDYILRDGKKLPSYEKIVAADAPRAIVLSSKNSEMVKLRDGDLEWNAFLSDSLQFESIPRSPDDHSNILYSSGTTGEPKAIPWTHSTPIKGAADAYLHQDIHEGDRVAWPTNLGWMMGPWLIYASLINNASMGLYYGVPTGKAFGEFVQNAEITMLGLVPSIVKAWKNSACISGLDWSKIKAFSSTGESSNAIDMLYLMSLAGYKPVIEYCGGTEIGGGYITGTLVQPSSPATFSTPALGLDVVILDENASEVDNGELFLVPPSIGLSQELLNRDHREVYYDGTPRDKSGFALRRHGDQMERLGGGYYRAHGRVDDTMNLSGIKISSAEIERVLNQVEGVSETAAISVSPQGGGPESLVIFTVLEYAVSLEKESLKLQMQNTIKYNLNPLFRIFDIVLTDALPRTASNKIMRRELRTDYKVQMEKR
jgi:acetyl-CoA synthetase